MRAIKLVGRAEIEADLERGRLFMKAAKERIEREEKELEKIRAKNQKRGTKCK